MERKTQLTELFPHMSEIQINDVMNIVLEQDAALTPDEQFEEMINLLVESGDSTLELEEENATGITVKNSNSEQVREHLDELLRLFPDIDVDYLTEFCQNQVPFNFVQVVDELSNNDYTRRNADTDPLDVWEQLKQMLPDADPIYLRNQARALARRPEEELQEFVSNAIENGEFPTMQDYLIKKKQKADVEVYFEKFSVEKYLKQVPNPLETFFVPNREHALSNEVDEGDLEYALNFLYNQFPYQRKVEISKVLKHYGRDLVKTHNGLKNLPKAFRRPREQTVYMESYNIALLKEVSFLKHEKQIRQFLKTKDEKYRLALEEARFCGFLQTCGCCFDDELIPEECVFCNKMCSTFCKDCVKRGAEHVIGKEETYFPCLADCGSEFDYATLQMVLDTKIFERIWDRKQLEEIRNADIDGLEYCPHCEFCMIPNEGDKVFKCQNIECMAETCRLCRHKAHIPLRCNEIEYDEDVKMRVFIENKMTEALLRKCWNCSKQFYKESGCNKMTCFCGAKMCYVCGEKVNDYNHFGNQRCPLYTENLREFHQNRVLAGANAAKAQLGLNNDPSKLKFDPTRGVDRDVA